MLDLGPTVAQQGLDRDGIVNLLLGDAADPLSGSRIVEFWTSAAAVPRRPGAYVIAIELPRPIALALAGRPSVSLAPGFYLYCGSAKGPGGLGARIGRHMRRGKSIRWHVDNLTEAGRVVGAWTIAGGDECRLVASLAHLPVPIEGFGSSDCRSCRSHLLRWPGYGIVEAAG